jgi:hypothetical protein
MKCIILKTGQPVSVDDDIYGLLNQWTWVLHRDGYAVRYTTSKGKRQTIYMHNVVVGAKGIDHIDGNKLNNQRYNLRACTQRQNRFNAAGKRNTTSLYKGVSKKGNVWRAQIAKDGKKHMLGSFPEERWAAYAYDLAAPDLFGEYARLNFPSALRG